MSDRRLALALLLLLALAPAVVADAPATTPSRAARTWLETLDETRLGRARLPYAAPDRTRWHYVPRRRRGLSFRDMDAAQRRAAKALVRTVLGAQGYAKAEAIFRAESVLQRALPAGTRRRDPSWRDPLLYHLAVFGRPAADARWAFRLEGHHLSVNLTFDGDRVVSATPSFFGASPAHVRRGSEAGLRPLPREEDLARGLMTSLPEALRRRARVSARAPGDVSFGPGRPLRASGRGVALAELAPAQQARVWSLIETYVRNAPSAFAEATLARYRRLPASGIRFLWQGGMRSGEAHAYRLESPTFVIEYVNRGDHVHTVWREASRDFGGR